jgi:hypothetical protein
MERVVCPFLGFYPDFKHPFSVANSHNTALEYLMSDRREKGIIVKGLPECYGFVIKSDDGSIRYADRKEAFQVALAAGQLKESYPNTTRLESYMIDKYDGTEMSSLWKLAEKVSDAFKGLSVDADVKIDATPCYMK